MQIPLTPRLAAIADWVPDGASVADIGTDHAYLAAAIAGRVERVIASDLRPGPLARAQETIRRYGVGQKVETRLAGGLSALRPGEADTIIIAGMGGILINEILEQGKLVAQAAQTLLLQPMTAIYETRRFLLENGYAIRRERLAQEGDKLYVILQCAPNRPEPLPSEGYLHVGQALFAANDPLLPLYLQRKIQEFSHIAAGLERSAADHSARLGYIRKVLEELKTLQQQLK